jgi:hypothetical protein
MLAISVEPFFFFIIRNNLISPASGVLRCGFTSSSLSFRNGDLKGGGGGFAHEFANETTLEISYGSDLPW